VAARRQVARPAVKGLGILPHRKERPDIVIGKRALRRAEAVHRSEVALRQSRAPDSSGRRRRLTKTSGIRLGDDQRQVVLLFAAAEGLHFVQDRREKVSRRLIAMLQYSGCET
jgi:hypothetical protein